MSLENTVCIKMARQAAVQRCHSVPSQKTMKIYIYRQSKKSSSGLIYEILQWSNEGNPAEWTSGGNLAEWANGGNRAEWTSGGNLAEWANGGNLAEGKVKS